MPTPDLLDFATLLAPIPGDEPAGSSVPFAVKEELEESRKEEDPDDYAPDDPMRPENPKRADWPGIIQLAQETLCSTSKDLLVAARLTEALTHVHGFAGLRDGLRLMRGMVEECWERMYPSIEDGDLEVRAGPFNWLSDADRGARFPSTLRAVPLLQGGERPLGWLQWKKSQEARDGYTHEEFEKALLATSVEQCREQVEDLAESATQFKLLGESLQARLAMEAPGMSDLRAALEDCQKLAQQMLHRKGGDVETEAPDQGASVDGAATGAEPGARAGVTRADIYRQLRQLATRLQEMEPHSPIPYLLQRAVELGGLPFPQLMQALIREATVLQELNRELGIKEEPPPEG